MSEHETDLIVVGGGPGGYTAAIRGAQLGLRVALIEERHVGGVCLNWGCIPTKALLRTSEIYRYMLQAAEFGLAAEAVSYDIDAIVERSRRAAEQLSAGVAFLLKKNKVMVLDGRGYLTRPDSVEVRSDGNVSTSVKADSVIVATGARARTLSSLEPHREFVWTYMEALAPDFVPRSILVVGSGAIGIEFASFFCGMGSDVTVVEMLPRILPAEDAEIAEHARERFEQAGIRFVTDATVAGAKSGNDTITVSIEDAEGVVTEYTVERVISAVGVVGNVEDLGLENAGVTVEHGVIETDGASRTTRPGVFAIGDVSGPPMLAHKAQHEGVTCVEAIAGAESAAALDRLKIPRCIYSHPQIASVGMTEEQAAVAGYDLKTGRFPFRGNGKAIAMGEPNGLVKTVFDAGSGQLLGAHMIGAEVSELIHGFVVAMNLETTEAELIDSVFPHPTLSETMHESVLAAEGRAIHI